MNYRIENSYSCNRLLYCLLRVLGEADAGVWGSISVLPLHIQRFAFLGSSINGSLPSSQVLGHRPEFNSYSNLWASYIQYALADQVIYPFVVSKFVPAIWRGNSALCNVRSCEVCVDSLEDCDDSLEDSVQVCSDYLQVTTWTCTSLYRHIMHAVVAHPDSLCSSVHDTWNTAIPRSKTKFGEQFFIFAGPTVWITLPDYVKVAESIDIFKSKLKTFLFGLSYNVWTL